MKPHCLNCNKTLRRYRKGGSSKTGNTPPFKQFGDYGDNLFCGLHCGYQFAIKNIAAGRVKLHPPLKTKETL